MKYQNLANDMGVERGKWSFGAQFGDLNNDGHLDLYLVNGYVSADQQRSYWYDFSKVAGGNNAIISDARNWPPMNGRSLSGYQQKRVWINDGAGKFIDVAQSVGVTDVFDGRSIALADFGNRGVLDAVVANQRAPPFSTKLSESGESLDRIRARGLAEQSECNRRAGYSVLEWTGANPGGAGGQRILRPERSPSPFRSGEEGQCREGCRALALRTVPDDHIASGQQAL
jgi:hypothetical protein